MIGSWFGKKNYYKQLRRIVGELAYELDINNIKK